jgi:hypothetical protein
MLPPGKKLLPLLLGLAFLPDCFSQNVLIAGGEVNPLKPVFWGANAGFNFEILSKYLQNDFLLSFGGIHAGSGAEETQEEPEPGKFLFALKDNLYVSLNGEILGLRIGVSASFGMYDIPEYPKMYDLFFNAAGLIGIGIFPQSLISITVDICPGYVLAFRVTDAPSGAVNDSGFMLPIALGLRLNLDKL